MKKLGFVGWRGMVGSVLMDRMRDSEYFQHFKTSFFSTSNAGGEAPKESNSEGRLKDAFDLNHLKEQDVIMTCQGGDYTKKVHGNLRSQGWNGYWIDAASALRMDEQATLILDPVNQSVIDQALKEGKKDFVGANCTVSLMLMAVGGLYREGLVEWVTSMTYQAASGAGANNMRELLKQMGSLHSAVSDSIDDPARSILEVDRQVSERFHSSEFPSQYFGVPLAGSIIPWIDSEMENGQTREEWKAMAESNKILGNQTAIPVDGTCVRIGAMRSHAQGLTIKLTPEGAKKDAKELEEILRSGNEWIEVIPNNKEKTAQYLTPAYTSGTLKIPVGRVRKMNLGPEYLNCFTVGDQLLWGAAEPLNRFLGAIKDL